MKITALALLPLALLASCAAVGPAPAPQALSSLPEHALTLHVGGRALDDDWEPVEDQVSLGLVYDMHVPDQTIGFEVGLSASTDDQDDVVPGVDAEATFGEFYGGVRGTFHLGESPIRPYVALGASVLRVDGSLDDGGSEVSSDDTTFGLYGRVGAYFALGRDWRVGLDFRHLFGDDADLEGFDVDTSFSELTLGFGFVF